MPTTERQWARMRRAVDHANQTRARVMALEERLRGARVKAADAYSEMFATLEDGWAIALPQDESETYVLKSPWVGDVS